VGASGAACQGEAVQQERGLLLLLLLLRPARAHGWGHNRLATPWSQLSTRLLARLNMQLPSPVIGCRTRLAGLLLAVKLLALLALLCMLLLLLLPLLLPLLLLRTLLNTRSKKLGRGGGGGGVAAAADGPCRTLLCQAAAGKCSAGLPQGFLPAAAARDGWWRAACIIVACGLLGRRRYACMNVQEGGWSVGKAGHAVFER
jgi:hypothetical protein